LRESWKGGGQKIWATVAHAAIEVAALRMAAMLAA
jgi:hypothetical protein